ncbi:MAG TPA: ADP-ribosylglycohydrolase family protein [Puia sp.]|nr:ADP-ribosylglycohydrolase family protein [Puia sp.]
MKRITLALIAYLLTLSGFSQQTLHISKSRLQDKIKGGWAGQAIGVTFGGPYEFRYNGTFIQDYQPLLYYPGYIRNVMINNPGLYDDLYMDLTFVDVFEKYGLHAPVDSFANAFAHAGYMLWHANQSARYNILNGIKAPASGNWINNPHADDIDYQIESDYAGLMSPGMPNTASKISDKIGHIMNYGDGWYGGVYIGAMYSLCFVYDDIPRIVREALQTIPEKSTYYQCIQDVIHWHDEFPDNWKQAWFQLQCKWSSDMACPEGIFAPFDIDSKLNSAYVVLGLLYGNGDFGKSLDIATRAGQDADCNPSTVGGILGALLGYDRIPAYWKSGLEGAEDIPFKYTTISLNKVYSIGFKHAVQNILANGGKENGDDLVIAVQQPAPVKYEQGFPDLFPVERKSFGKTDVRDIDFEFEGTGFVLTGQAEKKEKKAADYIFEASLYIDGALVETEKLPTSFTTRRNELFWKYGLTNKKHQVRIHLLNPTNAASLNTEDIIVLSDKPVPNPLTNVK